MFEVVLDGYRYRVKFHHEEKTGTQCVINRQKVTNRHRSKNPKVFAEGKSVLKGNDTHNKAVGRKNSLKSALKDAQFIREVRTEFWTAYHTKRGKVS